MTVWVVLSLVMIFIKGPIAFINDEVIAFSPTYFCYFGVLLAENLACSLLIINVLYYEVYRKRLICENTPWGVGFYYCAIAALLSLGLYWWIGNGFIHMNCMLCWKPVQLL